MSKTTGQKPANKNTYFEMFTINKFDKCMKKDFKIFQNFICVVSKYMLD